MSTNPAVAVVVPTSNEAGISPASLSNDELVERVESSFNTIRACVPFIIELRDRFAALKRGHANIAGCRTWKEFCETRLNRSASAIRKALAVPIEDRVDDAGQSGDLVEEVFKFLSKFSAESNINKLPKLRDYLKTKTTFTEDEKNSLNSVVGALRYISKTTDDCLRQIEKVLS